MKSIHPLWEEGPVGVVTGRLDGRHGYGEASESGEGVQRVPLS